MTLMWDRMNFLGIVKCPEAKGRKNRRVGFQKEADHWNP